MLTKNLSRGLVFSSIACSLSAFALSAQAASHSISQNCELGQTCEIPGNDGGQTHFIVKPSTGTNYLCEIKSSGASLKLVVTSGKDFKIIEGDGFYNSNPDTTIEIKGRFEKPNDQNAQGEIRFSRLPLSADGTVKCYAKT